MKRIKIDKTRLAATTAGLVVVIGTSVMSMVQSKHIAEKQHKKAVERAAEQNAYLDRTHAINEDLDRRIALAKQRLEEQDFYLWSQE
jgi:hypothetical protein